MLIVEHDHWDDVAEHGDKGTEHEVLVADAGLGSRTVQFRGDLVDIIHGAAQIREKEDDHED